MIDLLKKQVFLPGTSGFLRITTLHPVWSSLDLNKAEIEVDYSPLTDARLSRFVSAISSKGYKMTQPIGVSDLTIFDTLTLAPRVFYQNKKTNLLIHYGLVLDDTKGCLLVADPSKQDYDRYTKELGINQDIADLYYAIRAKDAKFQSKRLITNLLLVSSMY